MDLEVLQQGWDSFLAAALAAIDNPRDVLQGSRPVKVINTRLMNDTHSIVFLEIPPDVFSRIDIRSAGTVAEAIAALLIEHWVRPRGSVQVGFVARPTESSPTRDD